MSLTVKSCTSANTDLTWLSRADAAELTKSSKFSFLSSALPVNKNERKKRNELHQLKEAKI